MSRFVYFAYGSNMLTQRLAARCPSAEVIGRAEATGVYVSYCLASSDGSAKAGLRRATGKTAWGVLFSIDLDESGVLDRFEGAPKVYQRAQIDVRPDGSGAPVSAATYLPQPGYIVENRLPYAWYRALCAGGARQHALPEGAVALLAAGQNMKMPVGSVRAVEGQRRALSALDAAGIALDQEAPVS